MREWGWLVCTDRVYLLAGQVCTVNIGNRMSPIIAGVRLAAQQSIESVQSSQPPWSADVAMSCSTTCSISIEWDIIRHVAGLA